MGYNSPITIMQNQMKMELENGIYKAVQKVGIEVDKDELVKALKYDREQYDKGYNDGCKETAEKILKEIMQEILLYLGVVSMKELDKLGLISSLLSYDVVTDKLHELAKQYGVEVAE